MASEPEGRPGPSGPVSDAVKRPVVEAAVPEKWLREREHLSLAENVDRLAGDLELVTLLALGGYAGRDYDYFATELAKYGMAVIGGWMHKGVIFQKCKERGYGGLTALGRHFTDDEVDELRNETVAKALKHFRDDVLMKGKWDSTKGATLRTFFIGQCLIRFQNIYRRWWGSEQRARRMLATEDDELLGDLFGTGRDDIAMISADRAVIQQALREVKDDRVRQAMLLTAEGLEQAEIAAELGVTRKAVERMLANERHRQRRRGQAG